AGSAATSQSLTAGEDPPDVWIPDSSWWPDRIAATTVDAPEVLLESLAESPVVVVSDTAEAPATWREVLAVETIVLGDPLTDTATAGALVAALAAADEAQTVDLVVPLAQSSREPAPAAERIAEVSGDGLTVAPEQLVLAADRGLTVTAPEGTAPLLDHPVLLTTQGDRESVRAAATWLTDLLGSEEMAQRLTAMGFRTSSGSPPGGVGDVSPVDADADRFGEVLGVWSTLAVPTRALAVIDVSGSMNFDAGETTRIDLTVAATQGGLELFPGSASIGLWAFSQRLDGDDDYTELVPVRRLDATVEGATQRDSLASVLEGLPDLATGATALYETTLAAYQAATEGYDPEAVNSVLLFTDGENEDPFSISEDELITALEELHDPKRPVRIIAIGISADADAAALERIAEATSGVAFVAERPEDMAAVFRTALGARNR
ncbi:substrate-binding domain-containing protein, partial [Nocardioides sp.]|uniref:substrate-binding domain-containing protein n=1 Tax=Nocardioides sp. TaxID=35761 RepID=UPI0027331008